MTFDNSNSELSDDWKDLSEDELMDRFINYERIDPEVIRKIAFNSEYDDIFVCNKYLRFQIGEHQDTPDDVFEDIIKDDEGHLTEEQKEMLIEKRK